MRWEVITKKNISIKAIETQDAEIIQPGSVKIIQMNTNSKNELIFDAELERDIIGGLKVAVEYNEV